MDDHSDAFWEPRACFLPPLAALETVADLLNEAANAVLSGNHEQARESLRQADMPSVHAFAARIMGPWDPFIHRRRPAERPVGAIKASSRKPSKKVEAEVFARDGYRCRYCGVRVVLPAARSVLVKLFPDVVGWGGRNKDQHAAFHALSAVADHVLPHASGGDNSLDNLVTTCQSCNYGKGDKLLAELGLIDPRTRPPLVNEWDGLARLTVATGTTSPGRPC